ncbi:hypothetical protein P4393_12315 [Bacillus subtilis]|nr:hypothetical protein [Bacillus subtilis]MED3474611.1 hypothetical protein [Bacillus subtilis]
MKLMVVDVNRDETLIHEVLVNEGKHVALKRISGHFNEQARELTLFVLKERPEKLIIEDVGIGKGLLDAVNKEMSSCGFKLKDDGTVVYG